MNAFQVANQLILESVISLANEHSERHRSCGSDRMDAEIFEFADGSVLTIDYMSSRPYWKAYYSNFESNWGWLVDCSREREGF